MSERESENETYFDSDSSEDPEGMYGNEPEYSAAELALMADNEADSVSESDNDDEDDMNSSWLENLHWCSCFNVLTTRSGLSR